MTQMRSIFLEHIILAGCQWHTVLLGFQQSSLRGCSLLWSSHGSGHKIFNFTCPCLLHTLIVRGLMSWLDRFDCCSALLHQTCCMHFILKSSTLSIWFSNEGNTSDILDFLSNVKFLFGLSRWPCALHKSSRHKGIADLPSLRVESQNVFFSTIASHRIVLPHRFWYDGGHNSPSRERLWLNRFLLRIGGSLR